MTPTCTSAVPLLTPDQLRAYRHQGYLVVPDLFSQLLINDAIAEAEALLERRELIDSNNLRCRWQPHIETGECLFETFDPVVDIGPVCARLAADPGLLAVLAALYGEPACLFKDKLIFKPPGARGFGLHQDYIAWEGFPRSFLTVLIPLDPSSRANGCTEVYSGCHHNGCLSPEDGDYHELPAESVAGVESVPLELQPGDVAFFGCFTPHFSQPNRSDGWRRQLYLSYNARSDGGPRREQHYQDFHHWLRGKYAEYGKHAVYFE
jgi:ectoine hydroxylase-related dioxygenase (phytanoyl-CoA dioxygenase family)